MSKPDPASLTTLLRAWRAGDGAAFERVIEEAHADLQRMARGRLAGHNGMVTLAPAELVNEAVIRVMESRPDLANRVHFFATMSVAMRSVLVDRARERLAEKRGGGALNVTWTDSGHGEETMAVDLLALDQAMRQLAELDARSCQILEMVYFGGMEHEQIAKVLDVSVRTVDRDLKFARSWIGKAMGRDI